MRLRRAISYACGAMRCAYCALRSLFLGTLAAPRAAVTRHQAIERRADGDLFLAVRLDDEIGNRFLPRLGVRARALQTGRVDGTSTARNLSHVSDGTVPRRPRIGLGGEHDRGRVILLARVCAERPCSPKGFRHRITPNL